MGKKIGYRLLSMLLSLVLVLELVPVSAWAAEDGSTDLSSGTAETTGIEVAEGEASETVLGEVDGLREESQKHFRMADGSFLAVDYGMPVHFSSGLDEDGEPIWEEIDNTLLLQPETAQAAFSASGEADAVLGQTPASSYAAAGQNAAFSNSGAAASYAAVNGDAYTESCAYQDVPIYQTGQTYVLSGWAKADSVPDNVTTATGDDAAAKDKQKQFGLRAILTYADNTTEYHYVPFNPDVQDWQYTSLAIVPKKANTQVKTIRVVCAYERNCNTTYFDNISLVREAAQTMKYDKDGNLVSVKTTGTAEETSTYSGGNLKTLKTGGNGTFTYTYDDKHNLKTATNGIVTETMTYDSNGNALTATISPKSGTDKIVTTNTYTNSGNQLSTVKQRGAFTTTYNYAGDANKMYGLASSVVDPMGLTVSTSYDAAGRPTSSSVSQSGATKGSVAYQYTQGMLNTLTRTASGGTQTYNFAYDSFGNMTKLQVGSRTLAEYTYGSKNGQLEKQTYGNGQYTKFAYDDLNRTTSTSTSSGDTYNYYYAGDGQLHKMEDIAAGLTYGYNYDSLGRLIGASQTGGGTNLRASYTYDSDSRLKGISYSVPGLIDNATETYYYNTSTTDNVSDGALEKMALFSDAWIAYRYDSLSRLKERDVGNILTEHQTYLAGSGTCTTTTLPETFYTTALGGSTKLSGFQYAYNAVGNVTRITNLTDNTYKTYAYDSLGQLTQVLEYNSSGTAVNQYKYTYDNAGNITKWVVSDGTGAYIGVDHKFTYGNSDWKDLLTAFDGQSITYDGSGNPLSYYNGKRHTMTWRNGRELNSVTVGGKTYSYEYDVNGLRTRKTNADGTYSDYYWMESMLLAEVQYGANGAFIRTLKFLYDENNTVVGISVKNAGEARFTSYYYVKNLQGDVVAVYRSDYTEAKGYYPTLVASYQYDAWGKVISVKGSAGTELSLSAYPNHIAHVNPIRYRGYYYDNETGFYYLQSRYYDPVICRFINADNTANLGADGSMLSYNLFAYCFNNPVTLSDDAGSWPNWLKKAVAAVAVVAVVTVVAAVTVATAGAGTAVAAVAVGAAKGAAVGMVSGALSGAAGGAIGHRLKTGSWDGAGQAALDGMGNGALSGAITGAITGGVRGYSNYSAAAKFLKNNGANPKEVLSCYKGTPKVKTLKGDTTVYRSWGGTTGKYGHWVSPNNYGANARNLLALPNGNTMANTSSFILSKGTTVLAGKAAPLFGHSGGGIQWWVSYLG